MKKLLIAVISLLVISSCANNQNAYTPKNQNENITVYLNLTPTGLIDGNAGEPIESMYIDNGYVFIAEAGETLPNETRITSTEVGVHFGGWYVYEEQTNPGVPTIYTSVPNVNNVILQAFWTSDNEPSEPSDHEIYIDVTGLSWWNDGHAATYAYTWDNVGPLNGVWPGEYLYKEGNYYVVYVPDNATHIIISRVNPSVPPTSEGAIWNKTVDIPMEGNKNKLSINSDSKDTYGNLNDYSWSVYSV